MKIKQHHSKIIFGLFFLIGALYILFVETEKYRSTTIIMVKDLSQEQSVSPLGSLLISAGGSEPMQDAKLIELFIQSMDMYAILNQEFNLTDYYSGKQTDILNRLSDNTIFPMFETSSENLLHRYTQDLGLFYDDATATLQISFAHADPSTAQQILKTIIRYANDRLNFFEKENAQVILNYLEKQKEEKYLMFIDALKQLLIYQSKNQTINPQIEIESKSAILATLEAELVQKQVEYTSKLQYMNASTPEMKLLQRNIATIQKKIDKIKREVTGDQKLNVDVSDFELLKSEVEFNKAVYSQVLTKLEETNVLVNQNTKNLIVVTQPHRPDSYSSPNKFKDIFSLLIIISFIYGVATLVLKIIKDHKD